MSAKEPPAEKRCPTCGGGLATGMWCARCALGEVLEEDAASESEVRGLFSVAGHVVTGELGRGAAGIVYRARQEHPARDVAMKILRPHEAGSEESRARFRMEATTVAGLDHPAILPVLSVGEHDGLPYFTMKLCSGGSLAQRVERFRGAWREIATLVATLADAVHHAHQRGVLHRDLKPGNILFDEAERPFVSDFGIAKNANETASGGPVTRPLAVMGTRGYLAPEVLREGAAAATLAADVYGLGGILYELLAQMPPPESADGASPAILKGVPRDLAVIAAKCLHSEPAARYGSAAALAEDLRAWLAGRPIAARPVGAMGNLLSWAKRRPGMAALTGLAGSLLLLLAIGGPLVALRLARARSAAEQERDRATTEAATSQAVIDFLNRDLLGQASPDRQPDRELKLRSVLDRAAKAVGDHFADQPLVEAAVRETLGNTYNSLGEYAATRVHLERALEIRTRLEGADSPRVLRLSASLAFALYKLGSLREAEPLARKTLEAQQRTLSPQNPDALETMSILAQISEDLGRTAIAQQLTGQMLESSRRILGPEHPTTLTAMNDLAFLLGKQGKLAEAETLFRQALEIRRRTQGAEYPATLVVMTNLAGLARRQGHLAEAETLYQQLLEIENRVLGPEHPFTLTAKGSLALTEEGLGKFVEAEALQRQVLAGRIRVFGPENAVTLNSLTNLANLLVEEGNFEEAETSTLRLLEVRQRTLGREDPQTLAAASSLAFVYRARGKLMEAETLDTQTLASRQRVLGPEHRDTLGSMGSLALVYQEEGKRAEAETLLTKRLEISRRVLGIKHPDTLKALDKFGAFLLVEKRFKEAEPLLRESLQRHVELSPDSWLTASTRSLLGGALAGLGKFPEAEPLLVAGYDGLKAQADKNRIEGKRELSQAGARVVQCYTDWDKLEEAERWRRKLGEADKLP